MNKIKNELQYKILGIILYLFSSLAGLSILFVCSPRKLLFDENIETEKIKLNLYKNFAKSIYDNINTPIIKSITVTKDNENCPKNFETLTIKNQYNGKFSKFYGNKRICIERLDNSEYSFANLLKISSYVEINKNKKKCGKLFKDSNLYIYTSENMCPLNYIEITSISRAKNISLFHYKISPDDQYFTPIYGYDPKYPVITNIEVINNYRICLERNNNEIYGMFSRCEFPDNNKCFIEDNYEQIYSLDNNDNYKLNPKNLAKWNLANDKNIRHNFCKEDLNFNVFAYGYINFTEKNYEQFVEEFPSNDYTNNALYRAYKVFNYSNNIDKVFYLISYNLLVWSVIHFVIQIMLYLGKKGIRNIYIRNGIILFFFKLISLFGLIINYYCFFLKIEKVYIKMVDKPRNKILEYYNSTRKNFIIKIIIICVVGFLVFCFDLIVLFFSITIQWGFDFKIEKTEVEKKETKAETKIDLNFDTNHDIKIKSKIESNVDIKRESKTRMETKTETKTKTKTETKENNIINNNNDQIILDDINGSYGEPSFLDNLDKVNTKEMVKENNQFNMPFNEVKKIKENSKKINLFFICKDNISKCYLIQIDENESFLIALNILRETYPDLKEKNMLVFQCESRIINKEKTIYENGLRNNSKIFIISK